MKKLLLSVILVMFMTGISYSQELLWSNIQLEDNLHEGRFVCTDESNNIYVGANNIMHDIYVIKHDQNGNQLMIINDTNARNFSGMELGLDGKIYTIGSFDNYHGNSDGLINVYNPDGSLHFSQTYDFDNGTDSFQGLIVDDEGNAYVTGHVTTNTSLERHLSLAIKYSPQGIPLWIRVYGENPAFCYYGQEITIGIMGNIFISGFVQKNNTSTSEIFVLSYSQEGVLLANVMSELSDYDLVLPQFIFTDENDNVYTGGCADMFYSHYAGILLKTSSAGVIWSKVIKSEQDMAAIFDGALDSDGNIVICGTCYSPEGNGYIAKYSPNGDSQYIIRYQGPGTGMVEFGSLINNDGYTYLSGSTDNIGGSSTDIITISIDSDAQLMWEIAYNGTAHGFDRGLDIALDRDKNVIVTGSTESQGRTRCILLKYTNPLDIEERVSNNPKELPVYPNPTGEVLCFDLETISDKATYKVLSLTGQLLLFGSISSTRIDMSKIKAGSYLLQVIDNNMQYNAKFVKN